MSKQGYLGTGPAENRISNAEDQIPSRSGSTANTMCCRAPTLTLLGISSASKHTVAGLTRETKIGGVVEQHVNQSSITLRVPAYNDIARHLASKLGAKWLEDAPGEEPRAGPRCARLKVQVQSARLVQGTNSFPVARHTPDVVWWGPEGGRDLD